MADGAADPQHVEYLKRLEDQVQRRRRAEAATEADPSSERERGFSRFVSGANTSRGAAG